MLRCHLTYVLENFHSILLQSLFTMFTIVRNANAFEFHQMNRMNFDVYHNGNKSQSALWQNKSTLRLLE